MNNLSFGEIERLAKVIEEMGETLQVVGKTLLHGYRAEFDGVSYDNRGDLEKELGDVLAAIDLLQAKQDIDPMKLALRRATKLGVISKYMRHQEIP